MLPKRYLGFSLVELIVASLVMSLVVLGIVKVLGSHVEILRKSAVLTSAAAVAEDITSKIKAQPFNSVFSYDSDTPNPVVLPPTHGSFNAAAFMIPLDKSPMKPVLEDMLSSVKAAGFDRFRIDITHLRRDSSDYSNNSSVDDYVPFASQIYKDGAWYYGVLGCDYYDRNTCFVDRNGDGDYWDVVGGIPETPFTGLKMLTVTIYKKGEPVAVKHGTLLTSGSFSGQEISSGQAPLKLTISRPGYNRWAFQVSSMTKHALELPTRLTYSINGSNTFFDNDLGRMRIDNTNEDVTLNQRVDMAGNPIASDRPAFIPASKRCLRVTGQTDSGQSGTIQISDSLDNAAYVQGVVDDQVFFTPSGNNFEIWDGPIKFTKISGGVGGEYLMRQGRHRLWIRKQSATDPTIFSPYVTLNVHVDNTVPVLRSKTITEYEWGFGGLTPVQLINISDCFTPSGATAYSANLNPDITCAVVKQTNPPGTTRLGYTKTSGPGMEDNLYYSPNYTVNPNCDARAMVVDQDWMPWQLVNDAVYETTWEWGDNVGYKSSETYTFHIPDVNLDTTAPLIVISSNTGGQPYVARPSDGSPFQVVNWADYSLVPLRFSDDESGINFKSLKIEVCPEGVTNPMNLAGETPGCKTLFSWAEGKKPNVGDYWGNNFWFGGTSSGSRSAINFRNPGIGNLAGLPFAVGSVWQIRVSVANWAGIRTTTPDDYWRVVIVP